MPDRMATNHQRDRWDYECVEPALGAQLGRLDEPDLDADTRRRLEDHLAVCDACRLTRALGPALGREAARLETRPAAGAAARVATIAAGGGAMLLAASLVLMLALPPRSRQAGLVMRSGGPEVFQRPVDGEVVRDRTPRLRWRPVPGATAYRVTIAAVGGDYRWQGTTRGTSLEPPATAALPPAGDFRVMLEPVPEDLAPPGGWSTTFRTGGTAAWLRYRLRAAPPAVRGAGLLGGLALLAGLAAALANRRRATIRFSPLS